MEKSWALILKLVVISCWLAVTACATTGTKPEPGIPDPCCIPPLNVVDVKPITPKTKSYVVWNKNQFLKPRGLVTMSKSTIYALAEKFGAENMKPLKEINGFTIKNATADSALTFTSDEWVVQEEQTYYALETLYRHVPVEVTTNPQCPVCPGPNPNPDPLPTPSETAKSWGLTRVHALEAKAKVNTKGVKVCIVDTGIDTSHPDRPNILAARSFTGEPVSPDVAQHGTHVSGTVAGRRGAGIGVSEAGIIFNKGLDNHGSGSDSSLADAGMACLSPIKADFASFSWGGGGRSQLIEAMINSLTQAGVVVFIAAGNESRGTLSNPAAMSITNPNVYAVAASDESNHRAQFSNYGQGLKLIMPGTNIISNKPGGGTQPMSGTSMATPMAAGAATFCKAQGLSIQQCFKYVNLGLSPNEQGAGMVDLAKVVGL